MLLQDIAEKYPDSYVILMPNQRDKAGRVQDWKVLNTGRNYQKVKSLADYYRWEGVKGTVITSTAKEGMDVPPEESAKFFRVYYNMLTIVGVSVKFPLQMGGDGSWL